MRSHRDILLALLVAAVTIALYWPTIDFPFVNCDDHRYVTQNRHVLRGLTLDNVAWAFTTFEFANWHPLTWLSHMLDVDLHDGWAGGHHLTNVMLHGANAALLMVLLAGFTGSTWRSAVVAGLFAVHPLHVESVAWISERKDVLSMFFGLLAIMAYRRYARVPGETPSLNRRLTDYALVVVCFALSLMCKPMLVTLPFVLLLLDWWPLRRASENRKAQGLPSVGPGWRQLIIEKAPLLAMSIASSVITLLAQNAGGALRDFQHVSLAQRLGNAIVGYGMYLWQAIWPAKLAVFYPYPQSLPAWQIAVTAFALIAITLACLIASRCGHRAQLMGWLWFLGTLVPVIGLVQVGAQAHADRYTYVPLIGVFIMFAWTLPASTPARRLLSGIVVVTLLLALSVACWHQISYWRSDATLARRALEVTENNRVGHLLLGNALMDDGDFAGATAHLETATRIDPTWADAWNNLGNAYAHVGRLDDAMAAYRRAVERRPDLADPHYNLGVVLHGVNRLDEARAALETAISLDVEFAEARINLGAVLRDLNHMDEALQQFQLAVSMQPGNPIALINLGDALARLKRIDEARTTLQRAADAAAAIGDDSLRQQAIDLRRQLDIQK